MVTVVKKPKPKKDSKKDDKKKPEKTEYATKPARSVLHTAYRSTAGDGE